MVTSSVQQALAQPSGTCVVVLLALVVMGPYGPAIDGAVCVAVAMAKMGWLGAAMKNSGQARGGGYTMEILLFRCGLVSALREAWL